MMNPPCALFVGSKSKNFEKALYRYLIISQETFTCSKSLIETVEQDLKYFHSKHDKHQDDISEVFLVSSLLSISSLKF